MNLNKIEFYTLLLCNLFALCNLSNYCSPEYCNFAGECSLIGNKPSCECYAESFDGQYCEKVKDLCQTERNPCSMRESCVPYIGQMICECNESMIKPIAPTKPMCSYNVRAVYGNKHYIVLSFEELNTLKLDITVSTSTYLIGHINETVSSNHTSNLTTTLDELGIRRHIKIPYDNASYYLFETVFFTPGEHQLTVVIESHNKINSSKQTMSLLLHVSQPKSGVCLPRIIFQYCMDPKNPQEVDVEHFTNLQAIVEKRCNPSKNTFETQWTILNFEETITLYSTSFGKTLLFKLPQYSLWYETLLNLYPNILLSVRMALKESNTPWIYTRCYLKVTARNIIANIAGGHLREVHQAKWLILDGSKSQDPARRPEFQQQLSYTWLLSSENGSNEEYLAFQSKHAKLQLPANVLNKGITNRITLKVTNKLIPARSSTAVQLIRMVGDLLQISLDIKCIRNCHYNLYDVGAVLHLSAICFKCRMPINYTWILNGVDMQQNKPRFVTKIDKSMTGELAVQLNVSERSRKGYTQLKLQKSETPNIGDCIIEPKLGIECITRFHVRCEKNTNAILQKPIEYTFKLGKIYAESNNVGEAFLYLNGNDSLTIQICSSYFPCVLKKISFTVELMTESDMKNFQNKPVVMLEEGRRQQTFCMMQKIATNSNMDLFFKFTQAMKYDRTSTLLELMNTLEIVHKSMIGVVPLKNYDGYLITHLLERVVFSFDFIRKDNEILDMTEEMCLKLGALLTDIITYCIDNNENIERKSAGTFNEIYDDWPPFDMTVTQRMGRYGKIVKVIFTIWQMIGEQITRYIQPEEPYAYTTEQVIYNVEKFESVEPILYTCHDKLCSFEVPLDTVKYLQHQLKSKELMLQIWCFKRNIFWWASEDWSPTTSVLAVNIFDRNGQSANHLIDSDHSIKLSLRRDDTNSHNIITKTEELNHSGIVYKIKLHGHVNLLIDFLNTTKSIRILVTMNVEPTLDDLHKANCLIQESQGRSIVLRNYCPDQGIAYIAVYKANPFDSTSITYSYRMAAQECGVWENQGTNPHWIRKNCLSQNLTQNPLYFNFIAHQLSVFSAKEYPIYPFSIHRKEFPNNLSLNMNYLTFNILFISGVLSLLFLAKSQLNNKKINLIRVFNANRDEVPPESENIIVQLHTGGMQSAATTANIKLEFNSDLGKYKVLIYQNPMDPQLVQNTSCLLRLSDEKVQLPCRVTISHDLSGRYPTWYCRSLQVTDLQRDLSYTFPIYTWIKSDRKIRVSCYPSDLKQNKIKSQFHQKTFNGIGHWLQFKNKFQHYIEIYFINWFMFQPILGPLRYSNNSYIIYDRICIWTCKTILTVTVVFCYYQNITKNNYYGYEQRFTILEPSEFLTLALGSYLVTVIFDLILNRIAYL